MTTTLQTQTLIIPGTLKTKNSSESNLYVRRIRDLAKAQNIRCRQKGFLRLDIDLYYPIHLTIQTNEFLESIVHQSLPRPDRAADPVIEGLLYVVFQQRTQLNPLTITRFVQTPAWLEEQFGKDSCLGCCVVKWE